MPLFAPSPPSCRLATWLSARGAGGQILGSFRWRWLGPQVALEVYAIAQELRTFTLEQAPLQRRAGLLKEDAATGADDTMPRYTVAGGACTHGPAGGASSAAQPEDFRYGAISDHAPLGNAFYERVNTLPDWRWPCR